ncbi:LOW QUALITY PROTEIN: hypothetical protein ACHAXH_003770 [Discostella pseudostelligera]
MRLTLSYYSIAAVAGLVGSAFTVNAAEPQIVQKDRSYYAYSSSYAFGMGGLEKTSYDSKQKILYGVSEQGIITMIDYGNGIVQPPQLPFAIKSENVYTDVHVCSEKGILFASSKDDPNPGVVSIFKVAKRHRGYVVKPKLIHTLTIGYGPDYMDTNTDCTMLAIANEGEGYYVDKLINNVGSVSLVKGPFLDANKPPVVTDVSFPWTDDELIAKGVHLPLGHRTLPLQCSSPSGWYGLQMVGMSSLQENCALVKINVANAVAVDIYSYGLKSWEETPIDIIEDDGCSSMPTVEGLYSLRSPDAIKLVTVGEDIYIITANEGDDVAYGAFEERVKASSIFDGTSLKFSGLTADSAIFDAASPMSGQSKYFNKKCGSLAESPAWCAKSMRLTVGSESIDYSNPTAPNFKKLVAIGGRGLSIYKFTDEGLEMVWDSGDEFEREGCAAFPWAHNAIQDEEYSDVGGTLYLSNPAIQEVLIEMNDPEKDGCEDRGDGEAGACAMGDTVDERSLKDGYAAEAIVAGYACGKRFMVTVSEKNSVGFLYDISDITSPKLAQVFHLSPASKTKNPIVAYADRTLGEIDSESIIFLEQGKSPTGKAAIIFAGAWSSTTSFWEFDCPTASPTPMPTKLRKPTKKSA